MKLSVVILNYNVRYFLEQCLLSVQRALKDLEGEIIVIDNASSDDSCAMVAKQFPEVTLIRNPENVGFSKANNQAVKVAKGTYLCILNPDTAVSEHTFVEALRFAESTPQMGALGIRYQDGTGHFLPECKRNLPTPKRAIFKVLGFTKGKKGYYANNLAPHDTGEVEVLAGAFMMIKRELYESLGGFDEDYFMYGEDIDLSYKILQAGYKNYYHGGLCVLHYKGESTTLDAAYLDRFYGAMRIFYNKHFKKNTVLTSLIFAGVSITKFFRGRKVSRRKQVRNAVDEAWVLTEDLNFLRNLSETLDIPVKSVALRAVQEDLLEGKMLVFDTQYLSYKNIFQLMQKQRKGGNSFRIRPPHSSFIIGSDQSDQKGEVLHF